MAKNRHTDLGALFANHPVFTLDQACDMLRSGGPATVRNRLKHHLKKGRLRSIARGVYAVVPPGTNPESWVPDPFLVALAIRPDAIFSHHSALELLGAAHSTWSVCTACTASRRVTLRIPNSTIRVFPHPTPLARSGNVELGIRRVERRATLLRTTGPERTLVEGFRQLDLVGGVTELVASAGGFGSLDLTLLEEVLECYSVRRLWAAVGWFLERHAEAFGVREEDLLRFQRHRPRSPIYLARNTRTGRFLARWNLVLPPDVGRGDPDAGEP